MFGAIDGSWEYGVIKRKNEGFVNLGESKFRQLLWFIDIHLDVAQHTHGSTKPGSGLINVKVKPYSGFTNLCGHKENTVKNIAVQCYMVAKVLI